MSKESYLDYTFLSTRSSLNPQSKAKKLKEYIYDLHKTFDLNMELINKTINDWKDNEERNELSQLFNAFKQKYNNKSQKKTLLTQKQSKVLIETQILYEVKRKIEENNRYHCEKFKEVDENLNSKEEYIKTFEKKLKEVEIYIGKATKSLINSPYEKYKAWKIGDFLDVNNKSTRIKNLLWKEIEKIKTNINDVKQENMVYKDDDDITENKTPLPNENINMSMNQESKKKISAYLNYYKNQIRALQMRIKLVQNCFNNMSTTMSHLYFDTRANKRRSSSLNENKLNKTANIGNEQLNHDHDENKIEDNQNATVNKSILNLDMTRKLNHFMDFSIILNRRGDETKFEDLGKTGMGGLGNVTNLNMWDISCINKNN